MIYLPNWGILEREKWVIIEAKGDKTDQKWWTALKHTKELWPAHVLTLAMSHTLAKARFQAGAEKSQVAGPV